MGSKLELTWYGKEKEISVEPRILIEDKSLSYSKNEITSLIDDVKQTFDNILIHGDNLLALKALEQDYASKIKCVYIDPPYNTGSAFEHYDDNVEHSIWLSLMKPRLEMLRKLLADDGVIFIQIDDNEQAYLKVLCDEIFGRNNFINMICVKAKASSGASGGGEDRRLKKNVEYILSYSKSSAFNSFAPMYEKTLLKLYIEQRKSAKINFAYKSVLIDKGVEEYLTSTLAGNGEKIEIYKVRNYVVKSVSQVAKEEGITEYDVYSKYIDRIFTLENAQTSIRQRVKDATPSDDGYYIAKYYPVSGKNKNKYTSVGFMGNTRRLVSFLHNLISIDRDKNIWKYDKIGTLWTDLSWSAVSTEGSVDFPNGKKPEQLIQRIIEMSTNPGDVVLDSFLGSGTTAAVAQKIGRHWIGIEMGEQAYTHCKIRLDKVINNEDSGGITKTVNWHGGGGYKFYELAPTLIKKDAFGEEIINPDYNGEMLSAAVAKHEGYFYNPDKDYYWKQAKSENNSYLYVTTRHVNKKIIEAIKQEMKDDEFLLIVCKSFDSNCNADYQKSIAIKKIPQSLLKNCEFGVDNYNLNIVCPPEYEEEYDDE